MAAKETIRKKKQHRKRPKRPTARVGDTIGTTHAKSVGTGQPNQRKKRPKKSASSQPRTKQKRPKQQKKGNKRNQPTRFKRSRRVLGQLLLSLFLTIGLLWLVSVFTFTIHRVDSYMMTPALTDKDVVFVNKVKTIRRFDLVLLRNEDGSHSVRRVIGLAGDRLYYKNDQLYLNNEVQVERFLITRLEEAHQSNQILTADVTLRQATGEDVVPKNGYFVLGDNRQYAEDSRTYGIVTEKEIVGVVQLKLLPLYDMRYLY